MVQVKECLSVSNFYHNLSDEIRGILSAQNPTAKYVHYQHDILGFARDVLKREFTDDPGANQVEIALALQRASNGEGKRSITVKSGNSTGKTSEIGAIGAIWFLTVFPHSKVITTAPTLNQIENQMWPDIHEHIIRAGDDFKSIFDTTNKAKLGVKGNPAWYAIGRTSNKADNIQGFHAPKLLFIYDECPGIPEDIMQASIGALATDAVSLRIGNPTRSEGSFYDSFHKDREENECFTLDSSCSRWVKNHWLEARNKIWGENSPLYKVFVKGQFPDQSKDQLIALSWVDDATDKEFDEFTPSRRILSGDIASDGSDLTVLEIADYDEYRDLFQVQDIHTEFHKDPTQVYRIVKYISLRLGVNDIVIDANGLGEGVYSNLLHDKEIKKAGITVLGFKGSNKPIYKINNDQISVKERFANLNAQSYWVLAHDYYKARKMSIPDEPVLSGELTSLRWSIDNPRSVIKIIKPSKSPDYADANKMLVIVPRLKLRAARQKEQQNQSIHEDSKMTLRDACIARSSGSVFGNKLSGTMSRRM